MAIPGLRRFFRLPGAERAAGGAVDAELDFHLAMLEDEYLAAGHSREEARRLAARRFGDVARVRARCEHITIRHEAAMHRSELLADLRQDLAYAARSLRAAPGFTLVALLTLALGIGATTAIFSVVHGVLLRPLPYHEPDRLARVWPANPGAGYDRGALSVPELDDWRRHTGGAVESVAGYSTFGNGMVLGGPEPTYVKAAYVSPEFFATLGTPARLGRHILPAEHAEGANQVIVVSDGFWQRVLGGRPDAVGQTVQLNDARYEVVGVMPRGFDFPAGDVELWTPTSVIPEHNIPRIRFARWLGVVARLRPGATLAQADADMTALARRLEAAYGDSNAGWSAVSVRGLRDSMVGDVRTGLVVLLAAVAFVLLIACVNVANLILVRASGRGRELALRAARGAGRRRLARLLLTESLLLAVAGGALGVAGAWWGVRALVALSGEFLPRAADVRVDPVALGVALLVSLATGLAFGLLPALRASRPELGATLKESARGSTGGVSANRARAALVAAEVALAVVLVTGAGLMLRSLDRLLTADPGFDAEHTLLARFRVTPAPDDTLPTRRYLQTKARIVERVRALPGVVAAGATTFAPLTGGEGEPAPFAVPGHVEAAPGEEPRVLLQPASPGYLQAMGIPLLAGSDVPAVPATSPDTLAARVAVISRAMAERYWPGRSPVGEAFQIVGTDSRTDVRVIGVAGDVRATRLDSASSITAYVPEAAMSRVNMSLVVRTAGDPALLAAAVRDAVREVVPDQAFVELVPMRAKVSEAVATPRFFTVLVSLFGALALALAAVGLYGVVSYVVGQRQREIGLRVALGAQRGEVVGLMLRRAMRPVVAGLALGAVAALAATRLLRTLLYDVSATDPLTFAAVLALLAAIGAAAAYVPSRRAARVDPTVTLRME